MAKPRKKRKGYFSDLRFPVAKKYVSMVSRSSLLLLGGAGGLLILIIFLVNIVAMDGSAISNGPLTSNHASFGSDCSSCHNPFKGVSDDKCAVCHEKFGDELGVFSFSSHYLYRTGDFTRLIPSPDEVTCYTCHPEHTGRATPITNVPDDYCTTCHEYGSFNTSHPEFRFAAENIPDPSNLSFSHSRHVLEVRKTAGLTDLEQTCLYCHKAEEGGRTFEPIQFDAACAACHIASSISTDWLPFVTSLSSDSPGVVPLETIRATRSPGSQWSDYMNTSEFQERRDEVRKRPIYHADPWVLWNLNRLKSQLYAGQSDLASLLRASGSVDVDDALVLYQEALGSLRSYADELRATPGRDVQQALGEIDDLIEVVESRIRDPYAPLDETKFMLGADAVNPDLPEDTISGLKDVINRLTESCQTCHTIDNAAIARVQKDQGIMDRAEFDHRAHIIQTACLDCHNGIPIREYAARDSVAAPAIDRAEIQNLPSIQLCQSCHTSKKAASTCVTCHLFHPDKSQHTNLLRYLE